MNEPIASNESIEGLFAVKGKCIAITGGAGILGSTMAGALARYGAKICIIDYDRRRSGEVVKQIEADGGSATAVQANVLNKDEVARAFDSTLDALGKIDVLINGAGGNKKEATCTAEIDFFDLPLEAIGDVFNLNCLGTILPSQVFGRHMAGRGEGVIVNISSMSAFRPLTNVAAYSAAKAAVSNFTRWLATYMAQRHCPGIRVNAIAPGFFLTQQNRFLLTDEQTGDLTTRGRQVIGNTPMNRFGDPEELLGTVVWLISDASKFVTGIVVPIDGGFDAYSGV